MRASSAVVLLALPACLSASDFPDMQNIDPCFGGQCPAGMVHALVCDSSCPLDADPLAEGFRCFCIDAYEASRDGNGLAQSVAGATPWTNITWTDARTACEAVGKRLCTIREWIDACRGRLLDAEFGGQSCNAGGTVAPHGPVRLRGRLPRAPRHERQRLRVGR